MMTPATIVEKSVTCTDNSPSQKYPHPDDHDTGLKKLSSLPSQIEYFTWRLKNFKQFVMF